VLAKVGKGKGKGKNFEVELKIDSYKFISVKLARSLCRGS